MAGILALSQYVDGSGICPSNPLTPTTSLGATLNSDNMAHQDRGTKGNSAVCPTEVTNDKIKIFENPFEETSFCSHRSASLRAVELENEGQLDLACAAYEHSLCQLLSSTVLFEDQNGARIQQASLDAARLTLYIGLFRCQLPDLARLHGLVDRASALIHRFSTDLVIDPCSSSIPLVSHQISIDRISGIPRSPDSLVCPQRKRRALLPETIGASMEVDEEVDKTTNPLVTEEAAVESSTLKSDPGSATWFTQANANQVAWCRQLNACRAEAALRLADWDTLEEAVSLVRTSEY
ncbi:unnamed protein product [Protopolystoma xenopodis]|uniref:Uncharacterized protein n=1 Tax=Protopolystoma xenopodis TaxID=117903 RepID=A0A3S5CFG4_9PLAT|nr:unnamed protein product [Protopolystoma xenopodis]